MEHVLLKFRLNAVDEHLAGLADAAADDHYVRVHGGADVSQELAHVGVDLTEDGLGLPVTSLAGVKDVLAGEIFQGAQGTGGVCGGQVPLCHPDDACGGAVLLHAAPLAAVAALRLLPV